jgi:hypothetical protein
VHLLEVMVLGEVSHHHFDGNHLKSAASIEHPGPRHLIPRTTLFFLFQRILIPLDGVYE